MARRVIRVGGVHEPFNLPWIRAFEADRFGHLDLEVVFEEFAGGTGALVEALGHNTIDLATLLTEGAVTAIGRGNDIRIHSSFTSSPLTWGVHVAAGSDAETIDDLEGARFAISRYGSGSELMAYVLADRQGWSLTEDQFVVVGGVDGAVAALPQGRADVFLWERFVTAPLVEQGIFERVSDLPTPWPAFVTAARSDLIDADRPLIDEIVTIVLNEADQLIEDRGGTATAIGQRYGMSPTDTRSWLDGIEWPQRSSIDDGVLREVSRSMHALGRTDAVVAIDDLR